MKSKKVGTEIGELLAKETVCCVGGNQAFERPKARIVGLRIFLRWLIYLINDVVDDE